MVEGYDATVVRSRRGTSRVRAGRHPQLRSTHERAARRRPRGRRRHLRHRRRLPPPGESPTVRTSSSRVAPTSAAPGTCSATRASAPTATCTPSATTSSRGTPTRRSPTARRSWRTCARPSPSTASTATSASATRCARAEWSSDDATLDGRGRPRRRRARPTYTCNFLFMCSGYYCYTEGYTPEFPGRDRFDGRDRASAAVAGRPRLRRQAGRRDRLGRHRDDAGAGDGATAGHVTMLQRSPTYVVARPDVDAIANGLRKVLPDKARLRAHPGKNTLLQQVLYKRDPHGPRQGEGLPARAWSARQLGPDYDVDTHFTPTYDPWDQRLCLVPNGDLFEAITTARPRWSPTTSTRFTETGILLESGEQLEADIIVTATGSQLVTLGEMDFVGRRRAGRLLPDVDLQGLRLLRRAEPGVDVRLHQRVVDAARRPDLRVRVPAAQPHARHRHPDLHPPSAASDATMAAAPVIDDLRRATCNERPIAPRSRATGSRGSTRRTTPRTRSCSARHPSTTA